MLDIVKAIRAYTPWNEQEARDQAVMLDLLAHVPDLFSRENLIAHFTASAWITEASRGQVLMAYHRIYDAWAWTGGHADGDRDLLNVALREAREETGIDARPLTEDIFSLEILPVAGHEKKGVYVPSHLHLNVTYLLEADSAAPLRIKADENTGVRWFSLADAIENCSEEWMAERIYQKLNDKLAQFSGIAIKTGQTIKS